MKEAKIKIMNKMRSSKVKNELSMLRKERVMRLKI